VRYRILNEVPGDFEFCFSRFFVTERTILVFFGLFNIVINPFLA